MVTGSTRIAARYRRAKLRMPSLDIAPSPPALHDGQDEQDRQRDAQQDDGDGGRAAGIPALDKGEDAHRRDLRLEGDVARDEDHRAELADGAREAESRAGDDG